MKALLRACGQISFLAVDLWFLYEALAGSRRDALEMAALAVAHFLATLGFALLATERLGNNRLSAVFVVTAAGTFVPVVGLIGAAVAIRLAGMPADPCPEHACSLFDAAPRGAKVGRTADVPMSRLRAVLRARAEPKQRIAALLEAGKLDARSAIALYKAALKDPVDEVRLLAFSKIEGHRREIEGRIASLRVSLDDQQDPTRAAVLHHRLAEAHDQLAFSGLVEGDALRDALERAADHARIASRTECAGRGSVLFTLGRVLLRSGALDQAQLAFDEARACGVPSRRTAPYAAEIAFRTRNFSRVRAYVQYVGGMRRNQTRFRNVVAFWR